MSIFITIITITVMLVFLIKEIYDPLKIFSIVVTVFLICGYITLDEAVAGFSNKGVLAISALFIIAGSVESSSYFQEVTKFNNMNREKFNPISLFLTVTGLSSFLNNTPIVSIFIPITKQISNKTGISASKLLMPISYFSILGGMLTLIGTSTNLVISGLMEEFGLEPLGFFELTKVSIFAVVLGYIYIYLFYNKRLPDNKEALKKNMTPTNEHFVRFKIKDNSSIIGKTVKEAKLRALEGVYLAEIQRNNIQLFPITPDEVLLKNDVLIFAGQTDQIDELRNIDGLILETDNDINTNYFNHDNTIIMEVALTRYLGKPNMSIKDLRFREKYNAVVIGIIRNGQRMQGKIGSIQPKLGDILLLIAEKNNTILIEKDKAFTIITREERTLYEHSPKSFYPFIAFIGTVLITLLFGFDILFSALIGIAFLLITDTIQIRDALSMIEYKTIILIATSFAIGKTITNTGTATFIATWLQPLITNLSPFVLMIVIFLITTLFTTVITNNAAAILVLPIVNEVAQVSMYDIRPLILITAIAASSAFLSPYGYQTNTMVYGAGGYKFRDFFYFGYPLTIIIMLSSCLSAYILFFL